MKKLYKPVEAMEKNQINSIMAKLEPSLSEPNL